VAAEADDVVAREPAAAVEELGIAAPGVGAGGGGSESVKRLTSDLDG
jgi:hypothetical protein